MQANYNELSLNVIIPNDQVGLIIGRSGEIAYAIEKSTDTRLHTVREGNTNGPHDNHPWRNSGRHSQGEE